MDQEQLKMKALLGVIDNLWNICKNLDTCAWIFAHHLNPGLIEVAYCYTKKLLEETLFIKVI